MEFSVIYWIRNNFPFLCYLLLTFHLFTSVLVYLLVIILELVFLVSTLLWDFLNLISYCLLERISSFDFLSFSFQQSSQRNVCFLLYYVPSLKSHLSFFLLLVFWNSIHLEVASDSFCFLLYSSWLLVFILYVSKLFFLSVNLYCWKGL